METEEIKEENQDKNENANTATSDAAPPAEENRKLPNASGPKTKTITVDLPVEEHVPCIVGNEMQLMQIEVSFPRFVVQNFIYNSRYNYPRTYEINDRV